MPSPRAKPRVRIGQGHSIVHSGAPSTMSKAIEDSLFNEAKWQARRIKAEDDGEIRLMGYRARIDNDYQCPVCWMRFEKRSTLDPLPAGKDDVLTCDVCGSDFLIER